MKRERILQKQALNILKALEENGFNIDKYKPKIKDVEKEYETKKKLEKKYQRQDDELTAEELEKRQQLRQKRKDNKERAQALQRAINQNKKEIDSNGKIPQLKDVVSYASINRQQRKEQALDVISEVLQVKEQIQLSVATRRIQQGKQELEKVIDELMAQFVIERKREYNAGRKEKQKNYWANWWATNKERVYAERKAKRKAIKESLLITQNNSNYAQA